MAMVSPLKYENHITDKDLKLIKQLCLPYKIICPNLGISPEALRLRVARLMDKLGVENRTALVVKVIKLGLVSMDEFQIQEF